LTQPGVGRNGWPQKRAFPLIRTYLGHMYTIELEDEELRLLRSAIGSYLQAFGHNEADVLRAAKSLLMKLPEPAASAQAG
jgi:hypothetical protein